MIPRRTDFKQKLAIGVVGESKIANWLLSRGNSILPVYEVEVDSGKGPRVFSPDDNIIAPDMLVMNSSGAMWIEAKHKTVFSWHRKTQRWTTGIDLHHWQNYLNIADKYPWPVWLLFLHAQSTPDLRDQQHNCPSECPTGLFGGEIAQLRQNENHRCDNGQWGKGGMVYWSREHLKLLATLNEVEACQRSLPKHSVAP